MTIQLLATKTEIPPSRPHLVVRRHLLRRLDDGLASGSCLFLVSAPAGYGKTTLLTNWLTHLRAARRAEEPSAQVTHCAWLALDEGDNDPARFLSYLGAALRQADAGLAHRLISAISLTELPAGSSLLPVFVNEIAAFSDPVLLVLDDYHHISAQPVHDVVTSLLEFMPANLRLVIATRSDPPLPLARLRGCGQMTELRQHDLRFSVIESGEFLDHVMGLSLAAEHVAALTNRTEGWIAGLQMAAVSLQGRGDVAEFIHAFTGSHRHILDYLSEEVYRRQPADVRHFLVQTSILERFSAPLCSVVTAPDVDPVLLAPRAETTEATSHAQRILEHLEHANLFVVPLDDERRWYRYHHLFADLLRQRLEMEQPDAAATLHLRASRWFEQQQLVHDAIHHALAAHHYDRAAQLIEHAAETSMMVSEFATLRSWLESLPPATLRAHPVLCVYEAGALLLADEATDKVEERLMDALQGGGNGSVGGPVAVFRALMAAYQGKKAQSTRLAQRALELLPERSPFFRSFATLILALDTLFDGDDEVSAHRLREAQEVSDQVGNVMNSVLARCHLAEMAVIRNRLDEAEQIYQAAFEVAVSPGQREPASGYPLMGLGIIHFERNELTVALRLLEEGIELLQGLGQMGAVQGRVVLAKVRRALGDPVGAEAMLRSAESLMVRGHTPSDMIGQYVLLNRAQFALLDGDVAAADHFARAAGLTFAGHGAESDTPAPIGQPLGVWYEHLCRARLLCGHERYCESLHVLESLQHRASQQGRERLMLQALLEQALVHTHLGHQERALESLDAALDLAAPAGCIRLFVEAGEPMAGLLRLALRRNRHPEFTTRLLAGFADAAPPGAAVPASAGHAQAFSALLAGAAPALGADPGLGGGAFVLSPRELQVLDLVAQGMTNREIAARLTVALSTVKTHINHICRKLEVPNRTGAAAKARHLHLLADQ